VFDELLAYARERIAVPRVPALAAFLAAAGLWVEPARSAADAAVRFVLLVLLVVQFRLWRDIADREHERVRHPGRVLARHRGRATAFLVSLAALAVPIVALLATLEDPGRRVAAYGILALAVAVVYGSQASIHGRVMRTSWLLLQYPAFVLLAIPHPLLPQALVAAAVVYLLTMVRDWATSTDAADLRRETLPALSPEMFEEVACYTCGSRERVPFLVAEDDLTGREGRFSFVSCRNCRLVFLEPRLLRDYAESFYDRDSVRARGVPDWGWLTPFHERLRERQERERGTFVERHAPLEGGAGLDVRIDSTPLEELPAGARFARITMWDFLQRQYDPLRALMLARDRLAAGGRLVVETPTLDSRTFRFFGERWPGIQAPRHTVLFSRLTLEMMLDAAGLELESYHPHGTLPPYLYVFAGVAFKLLKGHAAEAPRLAPLFQLGRVLYAPFARVKRNVPIAQQIVVCKLRETRDAVGIP
jgi:hypothetical protein